MENSSMLSLNSRGLRLALGTFLVLGAIALAPNQASAQWSNETCMELDEIPAMFSDTFGGLDNCESLCKKSAGYCEKFVKDAASCAQLNYKGFYFFYDETECDTIEDSAARKQCKQDVKNAKSDVKIDINEWRDDTLVECSAYESACIAACMPL
jgi:hypothetical protein